MNDPEEVEGHDQDERFLFGREGSLGSSLTMVKGSLLSLHGVSEETKPLSV